MVGAAPMDVTSLTKKVEEEGKSREVGIVAMTRAMVVGNP